MNRVPMTAKGAELLRIELRRLEREDLPNVIKAIAEARAHGDLSENAEYHAAREQQSFIVGRIEEIKGKLNQAQIIDVRSLKNNGSVIFGATVTLHNLDDENKVTYQIVGDDEADLKDSKISINAPISRAIIGRNVGDEVQVKTPTGIVEYEILTVEYV